MFFEKRQRVFPGFPRMDHDGLASIPCDTHLLQEYGTLDVARGTIVVVVQADFTQCDYLGVL